MCWPGVLPVGATIILLPVVAVVGDDVDMVLMGVLTMVDAQILMIARCEAYKREILYEILTEFANNTLLLHHTALCVPV